MLLSSDPPGDKVITHCVGQGEVIVSGCGYITILHQSVVKMPIKCLLHVGNILYLSNSSNGYLLALIYITLRSRHFGRQYEQLNRQPNQTTGRVRLTLVQSADDSELSLSCFQDSEGHTKQYFTSSYCRSCFIMFHFLTSLLINKP